MLFRCRVEAGWSGPWGLDAGARHAYTHMYRPVSYRHGSLFLARGDRRVRCAWSRRELARKDCMAGVLGRGAWRQLAGTTWETT